MQKSLSISLLCCFVVNISYANCHVGSIIGDTDAEDLKILKAADEEWFANAKICEMGGYNVAIPVDADESKDHPIVIFRNGNLFTKGNPVFLRENGSTSVYDPSGRESDFSHAIVNIWSDSGAVSPGRILYRTVPTGSGEFVTVTDINFDGQPDSRIEWKGQEITKHFAWYEGRWYEMGRRCIKINAECRPAEFASGKWVLKAGSEQ
jgi:hypothetical protein